MFGKILIANRGEIAVRIARACLAMDIKSVAVYSDADEHALHVRSCDEAYHIGPAAALESYLSGDKLIEVARRAGCDAIHPGYGFLSENADFARAVIRAGLTWIGPSPEAITLMGSKIEAKRLAEQAGVPVVPGYYGEDQTPARLETEAERVGYPIVIKASAGGGGKGMRVVETPGDFREALEGAKREALAAFKDDAVMLERYLTEPRHIEVQVLGDHYGNIIHLGERECSIQRRHQKVVEESPSPVIDDSLRAQLTGAALKLARKAGYTNAGTVEFIFQDGEFFFLEMNTRLQVEHPVTEQALNFDLVEAQIRVAGGERLWVAQDEIEFEGHAIEARLYAEDPEKGFLPATGTI
ncbi:MAG TPA: biotin carboxylase N-terminal domain-containing protein, partial [Chloroflexia bacterium]|nr:biotin carboxylase N-terminal domain-containing protein [Chloroflexia bacterium]